MQTRRFIALLILFVVPLAGVVAAIVAVGWHYGDLWPLEQVVAAQLADETVLLSYEGLFQATLLDFRVRSIRVRQPSLLLVGPSLLDSYDPLLADDPDDFYNAWIPGVTPNILSFMLRQLPDDALPDTILWSLDRRFFADEQPSTSESILVPPATTLTSLFTDAFGATRTLVEGFSTGSVSYWSLRSRREPYFAQQVIGAGGLAEELMLGPYGEKRYGGFITQKLWAMDARAYEARLLDQAQRQIATLPAARRPVPERYALIDETLAYARQRGITVIGLLPPVSDVVIEQLTLEGRPEMANSFLDLPDLEPLFAAHGFRFFDLTRSATVEGLTDRHFFDAWHPLPQGATLTYRQLLANAPEVLGQYSDLPRLEALLASSQDDPFMLAAKGLQLPEAWRGLAGAAAPPG